MGDFEINGRRFKQTIEGHGKIHKSTMKLKELVNKLIKITWKLSNKIPKLKKIILDKLTK